jgi:hypothetical protein
MHLKVPGKELQPRQLPLWLALPSSRRDSNPELNKVLAERELWMILNKKRRTQAEGLGKIEVLEENPKRKIL